MRIAVLCVGFLKKIGFHGESSYAKDIGKFIFALILLLLAFEYFEHEFRVTAVHREQEKDQLLILAHRNMNLSAKIIEESIWLVNSREDLELEIHKEGLKKLLSGLQEAHGQLLTHSKHVGMARTGDTPIAYMDAYYGELTKNIRTLLNLNRGVLLSLGKDAETLRQVLSESPDAEERSESFSLDLETLASLFQESSRQNASSLARIEIYLIFFKILVGLIMSGAVYYSVRKGHRLETVFQGTHRELKEERDKLGKHHKEDQLNIETAKLLFTLINGLIPRYTPLPGGLLLFAESVINPCHKEGGDHNGLIVGGEYIYFYNADEAGHDVSTVLWSIVSRLMLKRSLDSEGCGPSSATEKEVSPVMSRLNRVLNVVYPESHFCTMVLGRIDIHTLEMHYSRAAHPDFYVIRGRRLHSLPGDDKEYNGDPFMGILEDVRFDHGVFQLMVGDKIIVLTDGFDEATRRGDGEREEAFGALRVKESIANNAELPVHLIFERLCTDVEEFTGKRLGYRVSKGSEGPREYKVTYENDLEDDASVLLLQVESIYDFQLVFELDPKSHGDLTHRVSEIWSEELAPLMEREGFSGGSLFGTQMAFDEAVVNAFKHGHAGALHTIKVGVDVKNDLIIHVFDQGEGFEGGGVPDPTSEENLNRPSGRGHYLIREYSAECSWFRVNYEKYTFCLQMIFRRYPDLSNKKHNEKMSSISNFLRGE